MEHYSTRKLSTFAKVAAHTIHIRAITFIILGLFDSWNPAVVALASAPPQVARNLRTNIMSGFDESTVCFFDCDDCLYFNDWGTAKLLTEKIEAHCIQVVH